MSKIGKTTAANMAITNACQRRWREISGDPCTGCPMRVACRFFNTNKTTQASWETSMSARLIGGKNNA